MVNRYSVRRNSSQSDQAGKSFLLTGPAGTLLGGNPTTCRGDPAGTHRQLSKVPGDPYR